LRNDVFQRPFAVKPKPAGQRGQNRKSVCLISSGYEGHAAPWEKTACRALFFGEFSRAQPPSFNGASPASESELARYESHHRSVQRKPN
jgi:hypothetical protein